MCYAFSRWGNIRAYLVFSCFVWAIPAPPPDRWGWVSRVLSIFLSLARVGSGGEACPVTRAGGGRGPWPAPQLPECLLVPGDGQRYFQWSSVASSSGCWIARGRPLWCHFRSSQRRKDRSFLNNTPGCQLSPLQRWSQWQWLKQEARAPARPR